MKILYPKGREKALTFSYDDGMVPDRRLIDIFNRFQVKATFHLNSGNLGRDGYVSKEEVEELYLGHEIACHGVHHAHFTHLPKEQLVNEIYNDRRALEFLTGYPVRGLSYPYGEYSPEVIQALQTLGIEYSRTVRSDGGFGLPCDFLQWNPTCHHNGNLTDIADRFLHTPGYADLPLCYIWGHSFEFARENNWDVMEHFCEKLAGKDDIWYATNLQIKRYLCAVRALVFDAACTMVYNPSAVSVWIQGNGKTLELKPGKTLKLKCTD